MLLTDKQVNLVSRSMENVELWLSFSAATTSELVVTGPRAATITYRCDWTGKAAIYFNEDVPLDCTELSHVLALMSEVDFFKFLATLHLSYHELMELI